MNLLLVSPYPVPSAHSLHTKFWEYGQQQLLHTFRPTTSDLQPFTALILSFWLPLTCRRIRCGQLTEIPFMDRPTGTYICADARAVVHIHKHTHELQLFKNPSMYYSKYCTFCKANILAKIPHELSVVYLASEYWTRYFATVMFHALTMNDSI